MVRHRLLAEVATVVFRRAAEGVAENKERSTRRGDGGSGEMGRRWRKRRIDVAFNNGVAVEFDRVNPVRGEPTVAAFQERVPFRRFVLRENAGRGRREVAENRRWREKRRDACRRKNERR